MRVEETDAAWSAGTRDFVVPNTLASAAKLDELEVMTEIAKN